LLEWSQIVSENGDAVWRTVFRILDHDADAHDCYQESFLAHYPGGNPAIHSYSFRSPNAPHRHLKLLICEYQRNKGTFKTDLRTAH
jgi:hypothetical protein